MLATVKMITINTARDIIIPKMTAIPSLIVDINLLFVKPPDSIIIDIETVYVRIYSKYGIVNA